MLILAQVNSFFKFLNPNPECIFTLAVMPASGKGVVPGYGVWFGRVSEMQGLWQAAQAAWKARGGAGLGGVVGGVCLHTTLNETSLDGRKTQHIQSPRVFCCDLDRHVQQAELEAIKVKYQPQLIVESSPGRYHLYWKVGGAMGLEDWRAVQIGLAWELSGDYGMSNVTAMIRVPGISRVCKSGEKFVPKIVHALSGREIAGGGAEAKLEQAGWMSEAISKGQEDLREERRKISEAARELFHQSGVKGGAAGKGAHARRLEVLSSVPEGGRNVALYCAFKAWAVSVLCEGVVGSVGGVEGELEEAYAVEVGLGMNAGFKVPLDEGEAKACVLSALGKARAVRARKLEELEALMPVEEVGSGVGVEVSQESGLGLGGNGFHSDGVKQEGPPRAATDHMLGIIEGSKGGDDLTVIKSSTTWTLTGGAGVVGGVVEGSVEADRLEGSDEGSDAGGAVGGGVMNDVERFKEVRGEAIARGLAEGEVDVGVTHIVGNADKAGVGGGVNGEAGAEVKIPTHVLESAHRLVDVIWEKDRAVFAKRLGASLSQSSYVELAKYMCIWFVDYCGCFKASGATVFLEGKSKWDSKIFYSKAVTRDEFKSLMTVTLSSLCVRILRCKGNGEKTGKGSKGLAGRIPGSKMPTNSRFHEIASMVWEISIISKLAERQDAGVVVFQNGVLDLERQIFEYDDRAPLKYSHPIAAKWCEATVAVVEAALSEHNDTGNAWGFMAAVKAETPRFYARMMEWFPGDEQIVELILRYFGYAFTTDYSLSKFMFFYGPTRAGKGSICRLFCALVGDHNYSSSDYSSLGGGFKSANMADKLLVSIEEVEGGSKDHDVRLGQLKKMLGGERITIERKYGQPYEDTVVGKFVLQSNEVLQYRDKGNAVAARMIAVGFERSFKVEPNRLDPALEILRAEADKLATLTAMSWMFARRQNMPFNVGGSRALTVGNDEVSSHLNVVELTVSKYLKSNHNAEVSTKVVNQLVTLIASLSESPEGSRRLDRAIRVAINTFIPRSEYSNNIVINDARCRGWMGVSVNVTQLLEDYPEILDSESNMLLGFSELNEVILQHQKVLES